MFTIPGHIGDIGKYDSISQGVIAPYYLMSVDCSFHLRAQNPPLQMLYWCLYEKYISEDKKYISPGSLQIGTASSIPQNCNSQPRQEMSMPGKWSTIKPSSGKPSYVALRPTANFFF